VCSSHLVFCQEQGGLRMGANFVGIVVTDLGKEAMNMTFGFGFRGCEGGNKEYLCR
jgi:hypothetical protein